MSRRHKKPKATPKGSYHNDKKSGKFKALTRGQKFRQMVRMTCDRPGCPGNGQPINVLPQTVDAARQRSERVKCFQCRGPLRHYHL